jgi:hypothetical protein
MKRYALLLSLVLVSIASLAWAQAPQQFPAAPAAPAQQVWTPDQLNNLVAPIALYPDPLLGQVLVASTYPLEIVEASQWLERYSNLTGQALTDAAKQQPWDPSVQALVAFPDVLTKLNQDVRWTTDLGDAFLAQQADVMGAVQRMRARAQGNGRLASNGQQTVSTQMQNGQQEIMIQPPNQDEVYVPTYDPTYVWGPPLYGYYPPLYYPGFGFYWGRPYRLGFAFGGWGGWGLWGWGPNWFGNSIFVNFGFFNRFGYRYGGGYGYGAYGGRGIWAHDASHRLGVPYANRAVAARYQTASAASRNSFSGAAAGARAASSYRSGASSSQSYRSASPQSSYRSASPQSSYRSSPQGSSRSAPSSAPRSSGGSSAGRSSGGGGHASSGGSHGSSGGGHHR